MMSGGKRDWLTITAWAFCAANILSALNDIWWGVSTGNAIWAALLMFNGLVAGSMIRTLVRGAA